MLRQVDPGDIVAVAGVEAGGDVDAQPRAVETNVMSFAKQATARREGGLQFGEGRSEKLQILALQRAFEKLDSRQTILVETQSNVGVRTAGPLVAVLGRRPPRVLLGIVAEQLAEVGASHPEVDSHRTPFQADSRYESPGSRFRRRILVRPSRNRQEQDDDQGYSDRESNHGSLLVKVPRVPRRNRAGDS